MCRIFRGFLAYFYRVILCDKYISAIWCKIYFIYLYKIAVNYTSIGVVNHPWYSQAVIATNLARERRE